MAVTQKPLNPPPVRKAPALGQFDPARVRGIFVSLVYGFAWALIALSIAGTFYGARNLDAPLLTPWRIIADVAAAPNLAAMALLAQAVLGIVQWGARQMADHDARWWLLYIAALALSAWWNWSAYGDPLIAIGVPWLIAGGMILLGDIFPELILVRERG